MRNDIHYYSHDAMQVKFMLISRYVQAAQAGQMAARAVYYLTSPYRCHNKFLVSPNKLVYVYNSSCSPQRHGM